MLKGLIILENGFEDSEALVTNDLLKRAGIKEESILLYFCHGYPTKKSLSLSHQQLT